MSDLSLYRRHRPQSFDAVVGQEHVVRTLRNAIERDRVHHAYLFVGSRGTGKTSMAKILARSLNCVNGPTLTPCGECDSCVTIAGGTSMDVIEMDAASNRSVDDIRELRERVGFAPAGGHWKVYILDEAHMLTREAWNAFLKTLEEPPPNTVFVLATTEAHKVMPTIVDRCQRFDFGRPTPENIGEVISRVAEAESITLEPTAIGAIARAANGSFRDALGTLDQLVAYSGNQIAIADVASVLGLADSDLLFAAADAIAAEDGRRVLELVSELASSGRDPARFAGDLVTHLRQLLVVATVGEVPDHFYLAADDAARLSRQAAQLGEVALVRAIAELSAAISAVREGDEARMTVELAMLKSARPEIDPSRAALSQRLERLERSIQAGGAAPVVSVPAGGPPPQPAARAVAPQPAARAVAPQPADHDVAPTPESDAGDEDAPATGPADQASTAEAPRGVEALAQGAVATAEQVKSRVDEVRSEVEKGVEEVRSEVEAKAEEVRQEVEKSVEAAGEALDLERLASLWPAVIEQVKESGAGFLSAAFEDSRPVALDAGASTVEVGFPPSAAFNKRKAEANENRERFADALRTIVGRRLSPSYVLLDSEPEPAAEQAQPTDAPVTDQELVEKIKAEFDAEELLDDPEEES